MPNSVATVIGTVIAVVFALTVIFVRLRAAGKPTSARKILIPPMMMSTGFLMYIFPFTRERISYAIIAFLAGCVLSYPLIATSKMFVRDKAVYLHRSKAFIYILLGLLVLRLILHSVVEHYVTIYQTGSLFFDLAFGMLVPWRLAMFVQYRRLVQGRGPISPSVESKA
ncbi:cytochrome c biogenesis protein CcdC [Alicyclobacillus fastidiosus]|uniref:Cytochrome c biogenesis protein CcdC n=1 Tax=Alicyclobacillus fastidiosus TaxID=392011 RepID=A0ABY6ZHJ2_9BACL|nr:cytochrome c biogenesis protein CcdC [Alicyclobacillus fastidiosus]WAH41691.1 cytochrome c biogenesis protein CcdC [Alicyclobacillus fastidiosus]GMA63370.1 protein CcdC [Alicyclobacillus fastidiosus]